MRRRTRAVLLATALGALVLAGCDSEDGDGADQTAVTGDADGEGAADGDGGQAAPQVGEPVAPPTEPAEIAPVPPERSVSEDGSTVRVEGDRAAFVLPSGNVACVLSEDNAFCQIVEKSYDVRAEFMMPDVLGDCTVENADTMTMTNEPAAWTCAPEDLAPSAGVDRLGWWAQELEGETLDADGGPLAVLPYGSTMVHGPVSCAASESGVTCRHSELGNREIVLARDTYWIRRY